MYYDVFEATDIVGIFQNFMDFLLLVETSFNAQGSTWENPTLDRMMEAASARASDTAIRNSELKTSGWQNFAQILSAGIIYE